MPRSFWTVFLTLLLGVACGGGERPPENKEPASGEASPAVEEAPRTHQAGTYEGKGIVESFDEASVTIAHGDIPGFMEAMTMNFDLLDSSLVEVLEEGAEVEFTVVVREDGSYYIDSIRPVK